MSGKQSSSSSPSPSGSSGRRSWSQSLAARLAIFLAKLAVLVPAFFFVWSYVQPYYSAAVAGATNQLLAVEEHGERVTRLVPRGEVIEVFSTLRDDGKPAGAYDAEILHFYIVLCAALVLALPEPRGWRRLGALGVTLGALFLFHAFALLVTVEHTYAVTLVEVSKRNYTPAEVAIYKWLKETFVYFAVQLVPAFTLLVIVVKYGGFGRALSGLRAREAEDSGARDEEPDAEAPRGRLGRTLIFAAGGGGALLLAAALWVHAGKVSARQAESLCMRAYAALSANRAGDAAGLFKEALRRKPGFFQARTGLGHALLRTGDASGSLEAFLAAAQTDPNNLEVLLGAGNAQLELGKITDATASYRNAESAHPESWEAHYDLAHALAQAASFAAAATEYSKAIDLNPSYAPARIDIAKAFHKLGRDCDALPHLEAYLQMDSNSPRGAAMQELVANLKSSCSGPPK